MSSICPYEPSYTARLLKALSWPYVSEFIIICLIYLKKSLKMPLLRESGKMVEGKHQESVSPPRQQLQFQILSDILIFELWNLLNACNLQGKNYTVNCGFFWSISALSIVTGTHLPPPDMWQLQLF